MPAFGLTWIRHPKLLADAFALHVLKLESGILMVGEAIAREMEAYAKTNARWTDRTGAARAQLRATATKAAAAIVITIMHGAPHGKWLEIAHAGVWGILKQTLEAFQPQLMGRIRAMIGG
jgi:hypothetical protein